MHIEAIPYKNDSVDDVHRGTVKFNFEKGKDKWGRQAYKMRNYSWHKVKIPNGSMIEGVNFKQYDPHTDAIEGENLTFIDCNMVNVEKHASWIYVGSYEVHVKKELEEHGGEWYEVLYRDEGGTWTEVSREWRPADYELD